MFSFKESEIIKEFIYTPIYLYTNKNSKNNLNEKELKEKEFSENFFKQGAELVAMELEKKSQVNKDNSLDSKGPDLIVTILKTHEFIPAIDLLIDFSDKMKKQGYQDKMEIFFEKNLDKLIDAFIYTFVDFRRFVTLMPASAMKIKDCFLSEEKYVSRIREGEKNPDGELTKIILTITMPHKLTPEYVV